MLDLLSVDAAGGRTKWALADVRANRAQGRGKLSARAARERFSLPMAALRRVNLHIDV